MYRSENTRRSQGRSRGRGRGRGQPRGGQRSAPYTRPPREQGQQVPQATPDDQLLGSTSTERTMARARDDLRLAKEWSQWFKMAYEDNKMSLPSPRNSHLVPNADTLKIKLDAILLDANTKCNDTIEEHCLQLIGEAEHKIKNPPLSLEQQIFKLMQDQQRMMAARKEMLNNYAKDSFESTLSAVSVIMKEALKPTTTAEPTESTT